MQPLTVAAILIAFAVFQVASYTFFRMSDFRGFDLDSLSPLLRDYRFWLGLLCSLGILVLSFTLVRISESSLVLVLYLYLNNLLVNFRFLPVTWRAVFGEEILTSMDRVWAYVIAVLSAFGLLAAIYLWHRGG